MLRTNSDPGSPLPLPETVTSFWSSGDLWGFRIGSVPHVPVGAWLCGFLLSCFPACVPLLPNRTGIWGVPGPAAICVPTWAAPTRSVVKSSGSGLRLHVQVPSSEACSVDFQASPFRCSSRTRNLEVKIRHACGLQGLAQAVVPSDEILQPLPPSGLPPGGSVHTDLVGKALLTASPLCGRQLRLLKYLSPSYSPGDGRRPRWLHTSGFGRGGRMPRFCGILALPPLSPVPAFLCLFPHCQ